MFTPWTSINGSFKDCAKAPSKFLVHYFQIPPTPYFCKRRGNTNYAEAFFIPRIFLESASRLSTASSEILCSVCKKIVWIVLLCKQYATSPISIRALGHLSSNGWSVQWLVPTSASGSVWFRHGNWNSSSMLKLELVNKAVKENLSLVLVFVLV